MHLILKNSIFPPFPDNLDEIHFGMGCFWGVEKLFWETEGVWSTSVGYSGGNESSPTYDKVCSGNSGHAEVVKVIYDPKKISFQKLLNIFWESHDPTQGMRQGNDIGSQYRSIILLNNLDQMKLVKKNLTDVEKVFYDKGFNRITTELRLLDKFYYAEDYHQQYLAKNPNGYCSLKGLGIKF